MNYGDLKVYQISNILELELDRRLRSLPNYWKYEEVDQLLRSSSSVTSNIV